MPLTQGIVWNLAMLGWRFWNRGANLRGAGLGARFRRWWWEVNNWKVPAEGVNRGMEREAKEFYVGKFGSSMGD